MIPAQIRLYVLACAFLVVSAASGAAGFSVGAWRAESGHAAELRDHAAKVEALNAEITDLRASIAVQNEAVAVAVAKTEAAEKAQAQAEKHAQDLAALSASRLAKLEQAVRDATTAGEVLQRYWELVK